MASAESSRSVLFSYTPRHPVNPTVKCTVFPGFVADAAVGFSLSLDWSRYKFNASESIAGGVCSRFTASSVRPVIKDFVESRFPHKIVNNLEQAMRDFQPAALNHPYKLVFTARDNCIDRGSSDSEADLREANKRIEHINETAWLGDPVDVVYIKKYENVTDPLRDVVHFLFLLTEEIVNYMNNDPAAPLPQYSLLKFRFEVYRLFGEQEIAAEQFIPKDIPKGREVDLVYL